MTLAKNAPTTIAPSKGHSQEKDLTYSGNGDNDSKTKSEDKGEGVGLQALEFVKCLPITKRKRTSKEKGEDASGRGSGSKTTVFFNSTGTKNSRVKR